MNKVYFKYKHILARFNIDVLILMNVKDGIEYVLKVCGVNNEDIYKVAKDFITDLHNKK